ncbi:hypothetical protein BZA05DRAFT_350517 [Tricharina praecox]|uniref:uncharacterized protein n=1 Tax=Tricharina praecox TaxID=43433 RepID=UPI002220FF3F|nr:uncharacterized protein BZA05DRAFT_350517 [Tricharina praecox]KAI5854623.1 hypothetical protein BZA05DRAFT_350517 [Tricharina praecox]
MLLPSALPCEFLAPSLARSSVIVAPPSYRSPPVEETGIVSATTTGLMSTCRRLQQILSGGDRQSPAPEPPRTPVRRATSSRVLSAPPPPPTLPKAPVLVARLSNKRTRSAAFDSSPMDEESDNSDKDFNRRTDRFATPPPRKRVRPTTPPPAPNRGVRGLLADNDDDEYMSWTSDDDRQLVELVLGKLQLSKNDWEECARSLGKGDGHSVGKRWESLLGNISLKDRRKRIGRHNLYSHRRILPRN